MAENPITLIGANSFRYILGIGVPSTVTMIGVLTKKLGRAKPWERSHFYLGAELTLAAFAAALLNIGDLIKPDGRHVDNALMLVGLNVVMAVTILVLLLFVLSLHQDWESKAVERPKLSFFWLIFVSNVIGFGLLAAAVILVPVS
jgi:Ca2+/Na+ antiporter